MQFDEAFWDDGEWVSWRSVNSHLARLELQNRYPNADVDLIPLFENLLEVARDHFAVTGRHLQVYGDLGELFGAIHYGIKLHRNYAKGSDGRLGNRFVEIKTITPFKTHDFVTLKLERNFSHVLIVKVSKDFAFEGRLFSRRAVAKAKSGKVTVRWSDLPTER